VMTQQRFIFDDQQFHNALPGKTTSPEAQRRTSVTNMATPDQTLGLIRRRPLSNACQKA